MTTLAMTGRNNGRIKSGTEWLRIQARRIADGPELPVTSDVAAAVEVEAWLQQHGVQYAPPSPIPVHLIDEARSRNNQARQEAILADSVERFTVAMRTGAQFPPIVVFADNGKLIIIDGNNRQAAARRAGLDTVNGIIIGEDTPSELIHLLTVQANARHGVTPPLAWRVQQAFGLTAMGWSDAQAAEAAGMSVAQLRNARTVQDTDQRARAMRIAGFADLPASSKTALSAVKDDAVFFQLSRLAITTAMTTDEIRDCTRALKALPSEGARLEHVAAQTKERTRATRRTAPAARGAHTRVHSHRLALLSTFSRVTAVDPSILVKQVATTHDRDAILRGVGDMRKRLDLIEVAMKALTDLKED